MQFSVNTDLAANASSLPRLKSDLYESIIDRDNHYGDVTADKCWTQEIKRLACERDAVILVHDYQLPEIQDIANYTSDSLGPSRITAETDVDVTVLCGVHFMTETTKILSPEKTVLIPGGRTGRSLADSITADEPAEWRAESPGALVVSYVSTTADVKVLTDICCTSSSAVSAIKSIPKDQRILSDPDQFLGARVRRETGRNNIKVWVGKCHVHVNINGEELVRRTEENAGSQSFIHPECGCASSAIYLAGEGTIESGHVQILPTGKMLTEAQKLKENKPDGKVLAATEVGMLHQLCRAAPDVNFKPVNNRASCSYTKLITLATLLRCLVEGADEVGVEPDVADKVRASVERMIAIGSPGGGE